MAYQTGSMKDALDLMKQLIPVLQAQGWVVDKQAFSNGNGEWYIHNAAAAYFSITGEESSSSYSSLGITGNTGFDGTKNAYNQPGSTGLDWVYLGGNDDPVISYDAFITPRYCHVTTQTRQSFFCHFGFGVLDKEGDYTGGQYLYRGSSAFPFDHHAYAGISFVRAELPGETGLTAGWYPFRNTIPRAMGLGGPMYDTLHPDLLAVETSQSALGGVLAPVPNAVYLTTSKNVNMRAGVVPDFCVCHMKGLTPRAKVEINSEQWMVFPVARLTLKKPDEWRNDDTFTYAYALRMNA
ncbi:hypothetical protein DQC40_11710 [Salmonella enterica subsp. enterica serovar Coeln]|nr:hypothetical protein [Salmonella enterica subsp. enterica serovar Coeln]